MQRHLAVAFDMDTLMYSKIEQGCCTAKRNQVIVLVKMMLNRKLCLLTFLLVTKMLGELNTEPKLEYKTLKIVQQTLKYK